MTDNARTYPDPPRPLTAHIRYRALAAKPVSLLLLICLVIVAVCAYTARRDIQDFSRIRRLKTLGSSAQAVVTGIFDRRPAGEHGAAREYIAFEFIPADSSASTPIVGERLGSWFIRQITLGDEITVIYDPDSPKSFFCPEVDDHSLIGRISAQIVFLVIALLLLLLALWRYFIFLGVVRRAPVQPGTVVDISSCAQGAFSRQLVVSLRTADRTVILKRIVPLRLAQHLAVGNPVDLLVPPGKPRRAIVAAAFL